MQISDAPSFLYERAWAAICDSDVMWPIILNVRVFLPTIKKVAPVAVQLLVLLATSMDYQFTSSQVSVGTDTMDAAPPCGSREHLQTGDEPLTSSPTSPHDNNSHDLSTLVGPPGTSGIAFPHSIHHDDSMSATDDAGAKLRKKFKKVFI